MNDFQLQMVASEILIFLVDVQLSLNLDVYEQLQSDDDIDNLIVKYKHILEKPTCRLHLFS